jgi:hypothetical protein
MISTAEETGANDSLARLLFYKWILNWFINRLRVVGSMNNHAKSLRDFA